MAEKTIQSMEAFQPELQDMARAKLTPGQYVIAMEKMSRAVASWMKALDLAGRLSLMLTGHADRRIEKIEEKSDAELMAITSGMIRKMLTPAWLARQIHEKLSDAKVVNVEKKLWQETSAEYQTKMAEAAEEILKESPLAA
jgi:hypothetical protein